MIGGVVMGVDTVKGKGLFFIGDPHLADTPPGQRLDGYLDQIMSKLEASLEHAHALDMPVVFLGDVFHWPRDNSNKMLVELIRIFGEHPGKDNIWILVGNHDKYQSRFTSDVSLAVLEAAGVVRLMKEYGPQFVLDTGDTRALVCGSPDGTPLPKSYEPEEDAPDTVIWVAHHNIRFPEFIDRAYSIKELPGIDWLVNGHIHRPQPTIRKGQTTWANPGNITRLTFTELSKVRKPAAAIWTPGVEELEKWVIPHEPFDVVFPDQAFPVQEESSDSESDYVKGLERLAWQRTQEGMGLKQFLVDNVQRDTHEGALIWELYEEVIENE